MGSSKENQQTQPTKLELKKFMVNSLFTRETTIIGTKETTFIKLGSIFIHFSEFKLVIMIS